jgi:23S rRNA pseudouridine2605 synthase
VSEKPQTALSEKLQKVLARAGFGSRREIETWIEQGRIKVNRHTASLGDRVTPEDKISVNGRAVHPQRLFGTQRRVIIYNKDFGTVCTRSDPEQRKTIFEDLPRIKSGRWISVGRLDINTSGLLLLTTDGELANRLMHPSHEIEREYLVRVLGEVDNAILQRLQRGVELEDGVARFEKIRDIGGEGANHWYRVVLREGRKREVRRLWESQGVKVSRLNRIRFGSIEIPRRLQRGQWQEMEAQQIDALCRMVGLPTASSGNERKAKPRNPKKKTAPRRKGTAPRSRRRTS